MPKEEQFEAIIWTSAKQTVLTADGIRNRPQVLRTLEDIFTAISITLDREDIIRARAEEQTTLTMEALAERRTLLIVDNLETVDDDRLLEFLRELPNPTKAIVTTRHRIDVASPVRLVGMSELEALALIGHLSQEKEVIISDEEARKLYNRTGGLPLALVWSISLMNFGHSVDSVLARLGSAKSDIIKFSFQNSIDAIKGQDAYKLLLALSLFAKDATREALGYVAGFGEDVISRDDSLVILEKLSLINKNGSRFSLLPLTKTLAESELDNDIILKRFLINAWKSYCLETCDSTSVPYKEMDQLDLETSNFIGFIEWCIANNDNDTLITFLLKLERLFWFKGYRANYRYYLKIAFERAVITEENKDSIGKLVYELASYSYSSGELENLEDLLLQALAFSEEKKTV